MGTAVLSPQDCFASPHNRHNQQLTSMIYPPRSAPRSGRKALQASVQYVIPSLASDCARWNSTSAVNSIDRDGFSHVDSSPGLLPVPGKRLNRAHSSVSRSSFVSLSSANPASAASSLSSPSRHYSNSPALPLPSSSTSATSTTAATPNSRSQLLSSRSASAGLPPRGSQAVGDWSVGRERLHASNGRLPFKVVQGNGVANKSAREIGFDTLSVQGDLHASKFSDAKRVVEKKHTVGNEFVGDLRKRTQNDFYSRKGLLEGDGSVKSSRKGFPEGDGMKGQRKEAEGKKVGKRRLADKANLAKDAGEIEVRPKVAGPASVVTILQRPKTKEAADELLARFVKKLDVTPPATELADLETQKVEGSAHTESSRNLRSSFSGFVTTSQIIAAPGTENLPVDHQHLKVLESLASPGTENLPVDLQHMEVLESHASHSSKGGLSVGFEALKHGAMQTERTEYFAGQNFTGLVSPCKSGMDVDEGSRELSLSGLSVASNDRWPAMAGNERWAGPAYSNSPPPSSLPFPKFSMRQLRTGSLELLVSRDQYSESPTDQPSAGTTSAPASPPRRSALLRSEQEGALDVAFATKDLRRILNLDCC